MSAGVLLCNLGAPEAPTPRALRRYLGQITRVDIVAFFNDYENLLGRDTLSSGGTCKGDLFNGGEATVRGLEAGFSTDPRSRRGVRPGSDPA